MSVLIVNVLVSADSRHSSTVTKRTDGALPFGLDATTPFDVQANTTRGTTVNFTIPALTSSAYHSNPFNTTFVFATILLGLSFVSPSRKRNSAVMTLLIAIMAMTLGSCGGGGGSSSNLGTSGGGSSATALSKTYKFTITGTSGGNSDTQVLTVTVQ